MCKEVGLIIRLTLVMFTQSISTRETTPDIVLWENPERCDNEKCNGQIYLRRKRIKIKLLIQFQRKNDVKTCLLDLWAFLSFRIVDDINISGFNRIAIRRVSKLQSKLYLFTQRKRAAVIFLVKKAGRPLYIIDCTGTTGTLAFKSTKKCVKKKTRNCSF